MLQVIFCSLVLAAFYVLGLCSSYVGPAWPPAAGRRKLLLLWSQNGKHLQRLNLNVFTLCATAVDASDCGSGFALLSNECVSLYPTDLVDLVCAELQHIEIVRIGRRFEKKGEVVCVSRVPMETKEMMFVFHHKSQLTASLGYVYGIQAI